MDMWQGRGSAITVLTVMLITVCVITQTCIAVDHIVGNTDQGWDLSVDYSLWASKQTFVVGDNLIFRYSPTFHTVLKVNKESYESCNTDSPLFEDESGNTTIPLKAPGIYYFICGTNGHCSEANMKLKVTVVKAENSSQTQGNGRALPPHVTTKAEAPVSSAPSSAPHYCLGSFTAFVISSTLVYCAPLIFL